MRSELAAFAVNLEMWWTELDPLARVAAAAEAGFGAVEVWFWRRWDVDELARRCRDLGLVVAQIGGWDFEPRLGDPATGRLFEAGVELAIEAASTVGSTLINLNGPYLRPGEDRTEARGRVADAIARVAPLAEEAGVTLMVEPMNTRVDHPGYSLASSEDVLWVVEAVASPAVGVNWDLYHLQISEGDLTGHFAAGFEHVAYVQVADHPGRHEPGTGEIAYAFLLPRIRAFGYRGFFGLECTPSEGAAAAIERLVDLGRDLPSGSETA